MHDRPSGSGTDAAGFTIRRATPDDAPVLTRLGGRLFEETFGAENRPEDIDAYLRAAFTDSRQRAELREPGSLTWLAEDGEGTPIGYVRLRLGAECDAVRAERPAEVCRLYADRGQHGRGVGAGLLERCVTAAREWGADVVWLGVWERNARAIAFYRKHGFAAVGETTFVLGEDVQRDLVMALRLDR